MKKARFTDGLVAKIELMMNTEAGVSFGGKFNGVYRF